MNRVGKTVAWICMFNILFVGCYTSKVVTKDELAATVENDVDVITKEGLEYRFFNGDYSIRGDTLTGTGRQLIDGWPTDKYFSGSISLADIARVKADKFSLGGTIAAIVIFSIPLTFVGAAIGMDLAR